MMSMIEQGGKKNGSDCPCKHVPLHLSSFTAAEQGNLSALRLRLSRHEQQQQPTYDSAGNTPLHYAAQHGHTELVALLLNTGAYNNMYNNINCSSSEKDIYKVSGVTPLHRACFSGATSSVRLLLGHQITMMNSNQNNSNSNSSSNTLHFLSLPDISFNDYQTPLHKCAAGGRYLVVQLLLDFIFQHDYSSIHSTTSSGSSDYNSGAEVSTMVNARQLLRIKDARGRTPLDVARDKQQHLPNRHAERQSVQRWDTIAGGCADWDICVQVKLESEKYKFCIFPGYRRTLMYFTYHLTCNIDHFLSNVTKIYFKSY
jgi:ankyrin repeat protein